MSKNLYHSRPDIQWPIWYKRVIEFDSDNLMDIPEGSELLSNNGISLVWRGNDGWIYKQSIPYLIENEFYFYNELSYERLHFFMPKYKEDSKSKYSFAIQDLGESEKFTDSDLANKFANDIIEILDLHGIRHGDLTISNVIVKNNRVYILDWAEVRIRLPDGDYYRPSKRLGADGYWLRKTFKELCEKS